MSEPQEPTSGPRVGSATSKRWLGAAVVATVLAFALMFVVVAGIGRLPVTDRTLQAPVPNESTSSLTVAVARTPGGPEEWSNWARVIKYMSEELGRPVTVRYISKEEEAADIIAEQDMDIAFICAHHYLDLRDAGEIIPICSPIIDGSETSRAMLLVRADDPALTFEDLEGTVVAASDKSSLGGYAYLQYLASEHGVVLAEHFSEIRLGDTQNENLQDLISGDVRVAVANSAQVVAWDMSDFKILEESPSYGCPPVVVDENMDPAQIDRIRDLLLGFDAAELLDADSAIDGFQPFDETDYAFAEQLRDACGHHDHD